MSIIDRLGRGVEDRSAHAYADANRMMLDAAEVIRLLAAEVKMWRMAWERSATRHEINAAIHTTDSNPHARELLT